MTLVPDLASDPPLRPFLWVVWSRERQPDYLAEQHVFFSPEPERPSDEVLRPAKQERWRMVARYAEEGDANREVLRQLRDGKVVRLVVARRSESPRIEVVE